LQLSAGEVWNVGEPAEVSSMAALEEEHR